MVIVVFVVSLVGVLVVIITMSAQSRLCVLQSAIDEAKVNLNKTREAFQHVINKAKDPNKNE